MSIPRSGEILDADIGWDANVTRNVRALRTEGVVAYQPMYDEATGNLPHRGHRLGSMVACATTATTRRARSALRWRCSKPAANSTPTAPRPISWSPNS